MLNKQICERCIKKRYESDFSGFKKLYRFEENWAEGVLYCGVRQTSMKYANAPSTAYIEAKMRLYIKNPPPEHCLYKLEHLMMTQDE